MKFRLSDSPWFWGLLFSVMSLIALGLISPKFDRRQRQVESRFLGRQEAAIERSRRSAGLPPQDLADGAREQEFVAAKRIIPLWTLVLTAGITATGSAVMLQREIHRHKHTKNLCSTTNQEHFDGD